MVAWMMRGRRKLHEVAALAASPTLRQRFLAALVAGLLTFFVTWLVLDFGLGWATTTSTLLWCSGFAVVAAILAAILKRGVFLIYGTVALCLLFVEGVSLLIGLALAALG
jgi:hypothetical protein